MKKTIGIVLLSVILILLFSSNIVLAATPTFTVTCEVDKVYGVAQTKEISVCFGISDFRDFTNSQTKGINVVQATLEFDEDIFEPISVNLTKEGYYSGISTKTADGEVAMSPVNSWTGLVYNPDTKIFVVENSKYINTDMNFITVTLKVKSDAKLGETTVGLNSIVASDRQNDIYPSNATVSKTVEILNGTSDAIQNKYIRILPNTTVKDFKELHPTLKVVKNSANTTLSDTDFVPTGSTTADSQYEYTIIAVGDINSDGKLTATDLSQLKSYSVGMLTTLNDNQKRAVDIKWDGNCTAADLSQIKMMITKLGDSRIAIWYGTGDKDCIAV